MPRTIFISYPRSELARVTALVSDLERLGHEVAYDQDLAGGDAWWLRILQQIRACDIFVAAVSRAALESVACERELDYATALGKSLLPVIIADGIDANSLPLALSEVNYIDYQAPGRETLADLSRAVAERPPSPKLPDALPPEPKAPISEIVLIGDRIGRTNEPFVNSDDQLRTISSLEGYLQGPKTHAAASLLLDRLSKRADLFASSATEISQVLIRDRQRQQEAKVGKRVTSRGYIVALSATLPLLLFIAIAPGYVPFIREMFSTGPSACTISTTPAPLPHLGIGKSFTWICPPIRAGSYRVTFEVRPTDVSNRVPLDGASGIFHIPYTVDLVTAGQGGDQPTAITLTSLPPEEEDAIDFNWSGHSQTFSASGKVIPLPAGTPYFRLTINGVKDHCCFGEAYQPNHGLVDIPSKVDLRLEPIS
jgi:hypothetical protein